MTDKTKTPMIVSDEQLNQIIFETPGRFDSLKRLRDFYESRRQSNTEIIEKIQGVIDCSENKMHFACVDILVDVIKSLSLSESRLNDTGVSGMSELSIADLKGTIDYIENYAYQFIATKDKDNIAKLVFRLHKELISRIAAIDKEEGKG